jgi:hypothetical protein
LFVSRIDVKPLIKLDPRLSCNSRCVVHVHIHIVQESTTKINIVIELTNPPDSSPPNATTSKGKWPAVNRQAEGSSPIPAITQKSTA